MKILVIGSGGREHAIVWSLAKSRYAPKIICIPGNPGIAEYAECVPGDITDIKSLADFAEKNEIDLTVVGPELPLALGVVDEFKLRGLQIFGPSKEAAKLESSKIFAKVFMSKNGIPTARFSTFSNFERARNYIECLYKNKPFVIKVDGLAAGKGVYVCKSYLSGLNALKEIFLDKKFGDAGKFIVIEDYIDGFEASCMLFYDGASMSLMPFARDYKKLHKGRGAPNTGGMGSYAPHDLITDELKNKIIQKIIKPTQKGLSASNLKYSGVLYIGLIIEDGEPYVLEYNVRFGDPEAQAVLPLLKVDPVGVLDACVGRALHRIHVLWDEVNYCLCKVAVSEGYPERYSYGKEITGLDKYKNRVTSKIFHSGTKLDGDKLVTHGGRVFGVSVLHKDLVKASDCADEILENINFDGKIYRKDIGRK